MSELERQRHCAARAHCEVRWNSRHLSHHQLRDQMSAVISCILLIVLPHILAARFDPDRRAKRSSLYRWSVDNQWCCTLIHALCLFVCLNRICGAGGLVLDVSLMKGILVNAEDRTVTVEAGCQVSTHCISSLTF
jgi:hypothetical protein